MNRAPWNRNRYNIRVPQHPPSVPGAMATRLLLLFAFMAVGLLWLMPLCVDPGAQTSDVVQLWIAYGGFYGVLYAWIPRVVARVRRTFLD